MRHKRLGWYTQCDKIARRGRLLREISADRGTHSEKVSPRRAAASRRSEQKGNQWKFEANALPAPFYEHSGRLGVALHPRFVYMCVCVCVFACAHASATYVRITYAHESSIRYLENRKAQSKQAATTSPYDPLWLPISPEFLLLSVCAFLIFPSAAAPVIPAESVCWERSARPRNFHFSTTGWSAILCMWFSGKLCHWHTPVCQYNFSLLQYYCCINNYDLE